MGQRASDSLGQDGGRLDLGPHPWLSGETRLRGDLQGKIDTYLQQVPNDGSSIPPSPPPHHPSRRRRGLLGSVEALGRST